MQNSSKITIKILDKVYEVYDLNVHTNEQYIN